MFSKIYIYFIYLLSTLYYLLKHLFSPNKWKRFNKITDNLWIGMLPMWFDIDFLNNYDINNIISLNEEWELFIALDFKKHKFDHLHLPNINNDTGIKQNDIIKAVDFLDQKRINNEVCLVHCNNGGSRSIVIVVCYLIYILNITPDNALNFIKEKLSYKSISLGKNHYKSIIKFYENNQMKNKKEFIVNGHIFQL